MVNWCFWTEFCTGSIVYKHSFELEPVKFTKKVTIKSAFQVLTKLIHSLSPQMRNTPVGISAASVKHVVTSCPAQPAWAEIRLHAAAAVLHCRKHSLHCPYFCMLQSKFPPFRLGNRLQRKKIPPSQMHFCHHIYFTTIGAFGYLSQPIPPSHSQATLTVVLWTPNILSPWVHDFCHFTFVTSSAVPNRMDSLPAQNNSLNLVLSRWISWEWQSG